MGVAKKTTLWSIVSYNDLGDLQLDKLKKNRLTQNLGHRLSRLEKSHADAR